MRRQRHIEHENHERWLVSYADFITLLFALFVVMFAVGRGVKAQQASESIKEAMEHSSVSDVLATLLGKPPHKGGGSNAKQQDTKFPGQSGELRPSLDYLNKQLEKEIASGQMSVSLQQRGLTISLNQAAFFPPGEDTVNPAMYGSLQKVAETIKQLPNPVRLEGHTDAIPIQNARFKSNWELSAARAIATLELFTQRGGIASEQLAIAGYADTVPLGDNATEAGRARNRRVDIVVLNSNGMKAEPKQLKQAALR